MPPAEPDRKSADIEARGWCFPHAAAGRAAPAVTDIRLSSRAAEALAALLPLLGCGEEAAALAFDGLADAHSHDRQSHAALREIAEEELVHDALLRALAGALPTPVGAAERMRAARRFHLNLGCGDAIDHLARIAALDSAVCTILARLTRAGTPIAADPASSAILCRIHADESRHVRVSRGLAMTRRDRHLADIAAPARAALARLLSLAGDQLEALAFDPRWLETLIAPLPRGLFER